MQGPVARPLPPESELMPDGRSACAQVGSETVPPREPFRDQLPALWRPDPGSARSADAQRRSAASRTWRSQWFSIPAGRRPAGPVVLKSRGRPGDATFLTTGLKTSNIDILAIIILKQKMVF